MSLLTNKKLDRFACQTIFVLKTKSDGLVKWFLTFSAPWTPKS